jgi:hypothetical protein
VCTEVWIKTHKIPQIWDRRAQALLSSPPHHKVPTVGTAVIHNLSKRRAGAMPSCPQHAQALILLLKSLHHFFFEERLGDSERRRRRVCQRQPKIDQLSAIEN